MAAEQFEAENYGEALRLTRDAYKASKAAFEASGGSFDKAQVANLEHDIAMLEKKAEVPKSA